MLEIMDDVIVEGVEDLVIGISNVDIGMIKPDNSMHMNAETTVFITDNDGTQDYTYLIICTLTFYS